MNLRNWHGMGGDFIPPGAGWQPDPENRVSRLSRSSSRLGTRAPGSAPGQV